MKLLTILLLLGIISCKEAKNIPQEVHEKFICGNESTEERHFFKNMKNFSRFVNLKTGKTKKLRVGIKDVKDTATFLFDVKFSEELPPGFFNKMTFRNDSVFVHNDYRLPYNLFVFNKNFKKYSSTSSRELFKYYYDNNCKDTVYAFKYVFRPFAGFRENHINLSLKEIWASRKRGILKVVYQDSIGDLWEGKYYTELEKTRSAKSNK